MTRSARTPIRERSHAEGDGLSPILSNALDAFYENGYHGTSVRDIARRTGVTVPALYYHHENKQAILFALLDHSISAVIEISRQAVGAAGEDPRRRLDNLVVALVLYMTEHRKSAAMDAEIRSLTAENRRRYSAKRRTVERLMSAAIEDGVAAGLFSVTYPADTARALLGMIQAVTTWFRPGGLLSAQTVAGRYLDIARHTVGARSTD